MENEETGFLINEWYSDIQTKGNSLMNVPEDKRTPEMCFVAIHYWGAALEYVPNKYKTYELCLYAVRHNTPVDEGCSALAFVPEELKTYELCLEAIKHDYLISVFWDCGHTVERDYADAINFVPEKFKTPELCFETLRHHPSSEPGFFNFLSNEFYTNYIDGSIGEVCIEPKSLNDLLNSSDLFFKALKQIGMPDQYNDDAYKFFEKQKSEAREWSVAE